MQTQAQIRQIVTEKIVAALESGSVPFWRKPWASGLSGYPTNAATGKLYRGVNMLLLSLADHDSKWWGTYNQWRSLGGQVRRGEKGSQIVCYKPITKKMLNDQGEEEEISFPLLKTWTVFHISQVEGKLDQFREPPQTNESDIADFGPAEAAFAATEADVRFSGNRAFYSPTGDFIQLPPKTAFENPKEFYGTMAHEFIHWSGHETRLHRLNKLARFGDESYAVEELVAELGSAFLLAELQIPQSDDLSNSVAYLHHWVRVLKRDHTAIFSVTSLTGKAVDFVLSFSRSCQEADADAFTVESV